MNASITNDLVLQPGSWTRRQGDFPRDCGVHRVFLDVAGRLADHTTIRTETGAISYRDLGCRANRLANYLVGQGVGTGDRVGHRIGVLLDRSPSFLVEKPIPVAPANRRTENLKDDKSPWSGS